MRQLAKRADVPPSTMNRLARALDFGTYDEFRALFRDSINEQSAGYSLEGGQVRAVAREANSTTLSMPSSRPRSTISTLCSTTSTALPWSGRCRH